MSSRQEQEKRKRKPNLQFSLCFYVNELCIFWNSLFQVVIKGWTRSLCSTKKKNGEETSSTGNIYDFQCLLLRCFGLPPNLGPMQDWGLLKLFICIFKFQHNFGKSSPSVQGKANLATLVESKIVEAVSLRNFTALCGSRPNHREGRKLHVQ